MDGPSGIGPGGGGALTVPPFRSDETCGPSRASGPHRPLPPFTYPQPSVLLDVETLHLAPLDAGGRWCRFRPTLHAGRPGGPLHRPGHRLAPMPSPIVGAGPRPPRCTASSGNTWRPTWRWPMSPTPWATGCRITWKRVQELSEVRYPGPRVSPGLDAQPVATTSWWPFPAKAGGPAPHAAPSAWPRPRLTWWTTSFPTCRCASGCCPFPSVCGPTSTTGPETASAVLHILLRALQATLREACPTAPGTPRWAP